MKKVIFISLILLCFVSDREAFPWAEVTHGYLSEYAAESSALDKSKGDYLKNLGFDKGLKEIFKWKGKERDIKEWLSQGAHLEDAGNLWQLATANSRSYNHFHNPIKQFPWTDAGLDDWIALSPFHTTGQSSLLWAQDGAKQESFPDGNWSWKKIREYYYTALTGKDFNGSDVALTKEQRDEYFARTFKGLGHQIHLIQDAAQPDHVRNDAHPQDQMFENSPSNGSAYFETWAKERFSSVNDLKALPAPVFPNVSLNVSYNSLVPITQFYDTDQYNGLNVSTGINQGMAEYTNSNFFSDDTIFAAENYPANHRHYFPFPKKSSTDLHEYIAQTKPLSVQTAEDGNEDKGIWIKKERDGETIGNFARAGRWTSKIHKTFGEGSLFYNSFYLDEKCHEDYAQKLIPRAVGYSAGLLNYFFRGEINMVPDKESSSDYVILNKTDEDMGGTFELWYDNDKDERVKVPGASWTLSINNKNSGNNKSGNIDFDAPQDIKEKNIYMLVFRGKMGKKDNAGNIVGEESAVVGKVVSLECETLTINGSDTITKNSKSQYTVNEGCGNVEWRVSGTGATINSTGLLTTGSTACGSLLITVDCEGCRTPATKSVKVTDGVCWEITSTEPAPSGGGVCDVRRPYPSEIDFIVNVIMKHWYSGTWAEDHREDPVYVGWLYHGEPNGKYVSFDIQFGSHTHVIVYASAPDELKLLVYFWAYRSGFQGGKCPESFFSTCLLATEFMSATFYAEEVYIAASGPYQPIHTGYGNHATSSVGLINNPFDTRCYFFTGTITIQRQ